MAHEKPLVFLCTQFSERFFNPSFPQFLRCKLKIPSLSEIQQQLMQTERTDEIRRRQKSVGMASNFWGAIEKVDAVGTSPLGLVGAEGQVVLTTILLTTCLVALIEWQLSADASILIPVMAAVAAGFSLLDHILLKIQIQRQPRRN